jgi:hypothetical protein
MTAPDPLAKMPKKALAERGPSIHDVTFGSTGSDPKNATPEVERIEAHR